MSYTRPAVVPEGKHEGRRAAAWRNAAGSSGEAKTPHNPAQSYRFLNRAILAVVLYCLAQPLLRFSLAPYLPEWVLTCSSIRFFGRPCPLCGLTRGINALMHLRPAEAVACHSLAIPLSVLLGIELCYRAFASLVTFPEARLPSIVKTDLRVHLALAAGYLVYVLAFYLG